MPIEFKHKQLESGLTIIAEQDREALSSAVGFFVKTGARDEARELMGVSHFLEHMMFKGAAGLSAEAINRGFDDLGARNNAYTSHEMTVFYAQVLPEHLGRATDLIGRMMRPALRDEDFDTEKEVILEEIAMYLDNPFWVLYEAVCERHYKEHAMGHRVLGTAETIRPLTAAAMRGYFDARYSADNTTVALAGNLDFDEAVDQVEALCASWPSTAPIRDTAPPPVAGDSFEIRDDKVNRAYALAMAEGPAVADDRRYAASILAQLLGGPDTGRLHWSLIETGLAEEAQAAFDPHDGSGQFMVYASGDPGELGRIWEVVEKEIAGLESAIEEGAIERLKAKADTQATTSGEKPADRMQRLGRLWTYLGEYVTLDEELERLRAVSVDDVRAALEAFPLWPRTVGRMLPSNPG